MGDIYYKNKYLKYKNKYYTSKIQGGKNYTNQKYDLITETTDPTITGIKISMKSFESINNVVYIKPNSKDKIQFNISESYIKDNNLFIPNSSNKILDSDDTIELFKNKYKLDISSCNLDNFPLSTDKKTNQIIIYLNNKNKFIDPHISDTIINKLYYFAKDIDIYLNPKYQKETFTIINKINSIINDFPSNKIDILKFKRIENLFNPDESINEYNIKSFHIEAKNFFNDCSDFFRRQNIIEEKKRIMKLITEYRTVIDNDYNLTIKPSIMIRTTKSDNTIDEMIYNFDQGIEINIQDIIIVNGNNIK